MRSTGPFVCAKKLVAGLILTVAVGSIPAFADVLISIDKSTQQMSVSVNGEPQYQFTVSTGRGGYGTPNGTYRPQWMARRWFSRQYYSSPMPHSIFFHRGYAIHGSYEIRRLGGPASHGCVRLHPSNARALYELVKREGMEATTIVVHGSHAAEATPRRSQRSRAPRWYYRPHPLWFRYF